MSGTLFTDCTNKFMKLTNHKDTIYALIDCNNFYASCERVFNPSLDGKPVLVLSNNDGCIVARSNEVKKLGIKMGAPFHEFKEVIERNNVNVFSSNYELYGDMSRRVMDVLMSFSPNIEIYSIDEAFLEINDLVIDDYNEFGRLIKSKVKVWTGIPVSVGIAKTKTLAKAAAELAKKNEMFDGVLSLINLPELETNELLNGIPVGDIWGIGRQYSKKLNELGIFTALDFKLLPQEFVRQKFTAMGNRTLLELKGTSCLDIETETKPRKGIASTRSFSYRVTELKDLKEAVSSYTTTACEKLRSQKSKARTIDVFITTNFFSKRDQRYYAHFHKQLPAHSNATSDFISAAMYCLNKIYKSGYKYKKAGVYITDIVPETYGQGVLFDFETMKKASFLAKLVDGINNVYGRQTVVYASSGLQKHWKMKCEKRSPGYTTDWDQLLKVR